MSKLLIVESPTKVKSIKKYLGADYEVMASMGHIRDLPKSKLGVDIDNNFAPQYINMSDKKDLIKKLKQAAADSSQVFLACVDALNKRHSENVLDARIHQHAGVFEN